MEKERLEDSWDGIDEVVLYGLGMVCERFIGKLTADLEVPFIIDQARAGTEYQGIPVIPYAEGIAKIKEGRRKAVVTTSRKLYEGIRRSLEKDGLKEYRDFCWVEQFAVGWYWADRGQVNITQVNTAVTTYCTLNCEKCNMFMPYHRSRRHFPFEEMRADMDALMCHVDYIFQYTFLGGEPFLNPDLHRIIRYAGDVYPDRIGRLSVATNATLIPDEDTLEALGRYQVHVIISDYTGVAGYREEFDRFVGMMRAEGIPFSINGTLEWKDFGFPGKTFDWGADREGLRRHMRRCSPLFHGVNDGRFYYCHVIWSAEKAGMFENPKDDYIELGDLKTGRIADKRVLSEFSTGDWEKGYLDFCRYCGGCGEDNQHYVPIGVQVGSPSMTGRDD